MDKDKKPYVLMISRGCPSEKYPTLGVFEFDQAKALVDSGVKVVFASVDMRSIRRWRKIGIFRFEKQGVTVYEISLPIGAVAQKVLLTISCLSLKALYKNIYRTFGKPSVVHAHFADHIGYSAARLKELIGAPLVITEHSGDLSKEHINPSLMKVYSYAYKKADVVIAVSTYLAGRLKRFFNIETIVVPNVVDTNHFRYSPKKRSNKFTFVSIGCIAYGKGFDILLKAFQRAFSGNSEVQLVIYGKIDEKKKIENLITDLGLNTQVILKGLSYREQIVEGLYAGDCFVLPSRKETFGVVYIEALATGTPVIATKCGGPEDFVTPSNGLLIPVEDVPALAEAMSKMHSSINRFDGVNISKQTVERFSSNTVAEALMKIYKKLGHNTGLN